MGKYDLIVDQLKASLSARPPDEPIWTALRRMFDDVSPTPPISPTAPGWTRWSGSSRPARP